MMNREIKFRCWVTEKPVNKSWMHYFDIYHCDTMGSDNIMQYTGLKDQNNKDIFEGDVVLLATENTKQKWEVSFFEGCFGFKRKNTFITIGYVNHGTDEIEIVGNKFENPQLLGGNL